MNVRLKLPLPHPAQQKVIASQKRFNVLDCGRRWGKTQLGIDRLLSVVLPGKPGAWFAPKYKDVADVWRELEHRLRPIIRKTNQQEHRFELHGGGVIDMWSLDSPDAGRGRAYAVVVIDEAAMVKTLMEAWQKSIRAQLTDYRGSAWFLSTPKGVASDFAKLFRLGEDPQSGWASWQMPTSSNPYINAAEIESARLDLTDLAFAQEYLAQFVSWEGSVFRNIAAAVTDEEPKGAAAAIGIDWGRTNDYTVFACLSDQGEVIGMDRFRGMEYSLQRGRLAAFWERNGKPPIHAESNSIGGPVIEQLRNEGIPVKAFQTTNASKTAAIEALCLAFERSTIRIPNDPVLVGELQAYEGKPLPSGLMQYSAPSGGHDDTVMALAIVWHAVFGGHRVEMFAPESVGIDYDDGMSAPNEDFYRPSPWRI